MSMVRLRRRSQLRLWLLAVAFLAGCQNTKNHLVMMAEATSNANGEKEADNNPSSAAFINRGEERKDKKVTIISPIPLGIVEDLEKGSDNENPDVDNLLEEAEKFVNDESAEVEHERKDSSYDTTDQEQDILLKEAKYNVEHKDLVEDSFLDPTAVDPSCDETSGKDCYYPPESTIETETVIDATCLQGGGDHDELGEEEEICTNEEKVVDKHWGSNEEVLFMRDELRALSADQTKENKRPPIFLIPGLASTRLVAWKLKKCHGAFSSDIKVQDNVWLNINLVIQMGTVNVDCMKECLKLGVNQSDTDNWETGCKLRPDEGLDAIASLAPGGIGSSMLIGGTNTVYAWLIQWLADNLGYDVSNIVGLPYDWRLTPNKMEERDGFLTMMRKRIEGAVATNGQPGIMVAHSMGNIVFRYFLEWMRQEMRKEAYNNYVKRARRRARSKKRQAAKQHSKPSQAVSPPQEGEDGWISGWMTGVVSGFDEIYDWLTQEEDQQQKDQDVEDDAQESRHEQFWELAVDEGDANWLEWVETHIWTYVGLSAPHLGAINPLRAVISGENMGLPITDAVAREMEVTFGSTHTINPISTSTGFCDDPSKPTTKEYPLDPDNHRLACLDDITSDIDLSSASRDPWQNFPALKAFMKDRVDWNSGKPMIDVEIEHCQGKGKNRCQQKELLQISPKEVEQGKVFDIFNEMWPEEGGPLLVKKDQLQQSFWSKGQPNILNHTWDRPLIKHIIMAYGVDVPTESGYVYNKKYELDKEGTVLLPRNETGDPPNLKKILVEHPRGELKGETLEPPRLSIAEAIMGQRQNKQQAIEMEEGRLARSGDGSVPYLSLSWAHTWLLHATRARRFSKADQASVDQKSSLDFIAISHRPIGATEWVEGPPAEQLNIVDEDKLVDTADTGTDHPHGTKYKPEMIRYHNVGKSRKTGIEYTTSVIEAIGVEHKEATRNYDILAAVFTDVLQYMHDDLKLV